MEMAEERSLTGHYLLRAAIMLGFAFYIVYLVRSEHLIYYIAPRMQLYVKLAAIALFCVALHQIYLAFQSIFDRNNEAACNCDHEPPRSLLANGLIYGLFLIPLMLGFLLPDQLMGSNIASIKGMNLSSGVITKQATPSESSAGTGSGVVLGKEVIAPLEATTPAATTVPLSSAAPTATAAPNPKLSIMSIEDAKLYTKFKTEYFNEAYSLHAMKLYKQDVIQIKEEGFMETMTTLEMFMEHFIGKKVEISGFVYREDTMKANQFVVARLAMQCCSADASPFGLFIESTNAQSHAVDSWVKLTGTLGTTTYNGSEIMKVSATNIEKISASKTPYVYPDYSFLD